MSNALLTIHLKGRITVGPNESLGANLSRLSPGVTRREWIYGGRSLVVPVDLVEEETASERVSQLVVHLITAAVEMLFWRLLGFLDGRVSEVTDDSLAFLSSFLSPHSFPISSAVTSSQDITFPLFHIIAVCLAYSLARRHKGAASLKTESV